MVANPRLDPYRNRLALLTREGTPHAYMLVLTEFVGDSPVRIRGRLRDGPLREILSIWLARMDGTELNDYWVDGRELQDCLYQWHAGYYDIDDTRTTVAWLESEDSELVLEHTFGIMGFDADSRPIWKLAPKR